MVGVDSGIKIISRPPHYERVQSMAVKYHCQKCGRRYVEWGAEKLKFECPECDGEKLVRIGMPEEAPAKPTLSRKPKRAVAAPASPASPVEEVDEGLGKDDAEISDNEGVIEADAEIPADAEAGEDSGAVAADLDSDGDLVT